MERIIHILFVDDGSYLVGITKELLERLGYIITSVHNSIEAIELIREYHDVFDVMITDYSMPGMNGIDLAIEANTLLADIPIILYTGKVELIDKEKITETGINEIVCKPCKINNLDTIIKNVIDQNR